MKCSVSKPVFERLPIYLSFLRSYEGNTVSSSIIATKLSLGDVQVRKDLSIVSGAGKPKIGYQTKELILHIEQFLGLDKPKEAVIVGAGKLGMALLNYDGFGNFGVYIEAAFDIGNQGLLKNGKTVYLIDKFCPYCKEKDIKIGIITVPDDNAQHVADLMVNVGIRAIWNFTSVNLSVPDNITVTNEKLAVTLGMLNQSIYKEDSL